MQRSNSRRISSSRPLPYHGFFSGFSTTRSSASSTEKKIIHPRPSQLSLFHLFQVRVMTFTFSVPSHYARGGETQAHMNVFHSFYARVCLIRVLRYVSTIIQVRGIHIDCCDGRTADLPQHVPSVSLSSPDYAHLLVLHDCLNDRQSAAEGRRPGGLPIRRRRRR